METSALLNNNTINVTQSDYREVFKNYEINELEANIMLKLIDKYNNKEKYDFYPELPKVFKGIADGMRNLAIKEGAPISKNDAAKMVLQEIAHDAEFNNAMDSFQNEINSTVIEMNTGYSKILNEAFEDAFAKIDEYETTDPEQAEKIRAVKKAFDDSMNFDRQLEYINKNSINKLRKFIDRFSSERIYFNKLVNTTDVKVPDIGELLLIIHRELPEYEVDDIKVFLIAIIKTSYSLNVEKNIADMAYIYKLINNIYTYKFITDTTNDETATLLFGNIAKVLDCIKNK